MSDNDLKESHQDVCSESEHSVRSLADSTQKLGVNVCATSADPIQERTVDKFMNLITPQSAPYKGNPPGHVLTEKAGSCNGGKLLETPTHTNPLRTTPPTLSCHCGWAMDRGRGVLAEGAKISTVPAWLNLKTKSLYGH